MKCISHDHIDAVGQCNTCWGWLCKGCMSNFTKPICPNCNLQWWENRKKEILWLRIKLPLYGLGIGFLITIWNTPNMTHYNDTQYLISFGIFSILWVFIYFWWIWINELNKDTIIIRANEWIVIMVLRKVFKLIFAWMIWAFVWPYEIYKLRKEYKKSLSMIDMCKTLISQNTHS